MPEPDRRTFYELLATVEAGTPDEALAARVTITMPREADRGDPVDCAAPPTEPEAT